MAHHRHIPHSAARIAMLRILSVHLLPMLEKKLVEKPVSIQWGGYPIVKSYPIRMILAAYEHLPADTPVEAFVENKDSLQDKSDEWIYAMAFLCGLRDTEDFSSPIHDDYAPVFLHLLNRPCLKQVLDNLVSKQKKRMVRILLASAAMELTCFAL